MISADVIRQASVGYYRVISAEIVRSAKHDESEDFKNDKTITNSNERENSTSCLKKCPCYFPNTSVKNQPILTIFGYTKSKRNLTPESYRLTHVNFCRTILRNVKSDIEQKRWLKS